MVLVFIFWGGIFFIGLGYYYCRQAKDVGVKAKVLEDTPTTASEDIRKPGYFEVKGQIQAVNPLIAPCTDREVVWYRHRLFEEYWEVCRGRKSNSWRYRTIPVQDDSCEIEFLVKDNTGTIAVHPQGAELTGTVVCNRYRSGDGCLYWFYRAFLNIVFLPYYLLCLMFGSGRTGSRYRDYVVALPKGEELYAIGPVNFDKESGNIRFQQDEGEERPYIISTKSEEELTDEIRSDQIGKRMMGHTFICMGSLLLFGIVIVINPWLRELLYSLIVRFGKTILNLFSS